MDHPPSTQNLSKSRTPATTDSPRAAQRDDHKTRKRLLAELLELRAQLQRLGMPESTEPAIDQARTHDLQEEAMPLSPPLTHPRASHIPSDSTPHGAILPVSREAEDRQRAYAHLSRQMDFTRTITDSLEEGVCTVDHSGRLSFMNLAAQALLGWSQAEMLGKPLDEYIHVHSPDDAFTSDSGLCSIESVLRTGKTASVRHDRFRRRDDSTFPCEFVCAPILSGQGVSGAAIVFKDLTDLRRMERTLASAQARFRATFEQAAVGLAHVALDGRWLQVNVRLCEIVGYAHELLEDRRGLDLVLPDDAERERESIRRLLTGQLTTDRREQWYVRQDGSLVWIQATWSLVRDTQGAPDYFLLVVEDRSQKWRLDQELQSLLGREQVARRAAEAANWELQTLLAVTDTVLRRFSPEEMLRGLLNQVRTMLAVDGIALLVREEGTPMLRVYLADGFDEAEMSMVRLPVGEGLVGRIAATGETLIADDLATMEEANAVLYGELRSAAGVPLYVGDQIIGALHVGTSTPRHFTSRDVRVLQRVADRAALAIERGQRNHETMGGVGGVGGSGSSNQISYSD